MSSLALIVGEDLSISLQRVKHGHCFKSTGMTQAHLLNYLSTQRILLTLMFFLDNFVIPVLLSPLKHSVVVITGFDQLEIVINERAAYCQICDVQCQ